MNAERIFITGGTGFIGTQLCRELIHLNPGHELVLYDNLHPQAQGDIHHTCVNIEKAYKLLNWSPQISMGEGLAKLVTWVKTQN